MFEQDAARLIRAAGWRIAMGPFYNTNLGRRGIYVWSIKSVLSKEELKQRGIKLHKNAPVGGQRTVRFRGVVEDGVLVSVEHLTTSARKKLSSGKRGPSRRRKKSKRVGGVSPLATGMGK